MPNDSSSPPEAEASPLRGPSAHRSHRKEVPPATPHLFAPTPERPIRCKYVQHAADTQVVPHRHPWAQLAYSSRGVTRLSAAQGTFMAPPSRAVWIPPGVEHAVTMVEACDYFTLYLHQEPGQSGPGALGTLTQASDESANAEKPQPSSGPGGSPEPLSRTVDKQRDWSVCQVLEVTDLLRAVILALDHGSDLQAPPEGSERLRQQRLEAVLLDELARARLVPLGLPMPRDKRLRQLCEAIIDDPARHSTLAGWATEAAASERTLARLFRTELSSSFARWRQQALIARAMTLAARGESMNRIASALGYANASAFSAMVRRELGSTPRELFGQRGDKQLSELS